MQITIAHNMVYLKQTPPVAVIFTLYQANIKPKDTMSEADMIDTNLLKSASPHFKLYLPNIKAV